MCRIQKVFLCFCLNVKGVEERNGCVRGDVWCDVEAISDMRSPKVHVRVPAIQFNCGYEEYSSAIFFIYQDNIFRVMSWLENSVL